MGEGAPQARALCVGGDVATGRRCGGGGVGWTVRNARGAPPARRAATQAGGRMRSGLPAPRAPRGAPGRAGRRGSGEPARARGAPAPGRGRKQQHHGSGISGAGRAGRRPAAAQKDLVEGLLGAAPAARPPRARAQGRGRARRRGAARQGLGEAGRRRPLRGREIWNSEGTRGLAGRKWAVWDAGSQECRTRQCTDPTREVHGWRGGGGFAAGTRAAGSAARPARAAPAGGGWGSWGRARAGGFGCGPRQARRIGEHTRVVGCCGAGLGGGGAGAGRCGVCVRAGARGAGSVWGRHSEQNGPAGGGSWDPGGQGPGGGGRASRHQQGGRRGAAGRARRAPPPRAWRRRPMSNLRTFQMHIPIG
jgi:translation initiation factor IF-2